MSTHEDLLATIRYVRDRTGDPNAWQTGLTPTEVTAVVTSTTRSEQLDAILRKIRQRHSNLYYPAPPDREQGDAARAIADAEAALAHQNSATAQLDLQVVSAILNAHLKTVEVANRCTSFSKRSKPRYAFDPIWTLRPARVISSVS